MTSSTSHLFYLHFNINLSSFSPPACVHKDEPSSAVDIELKRTFSTAQRTHSNTEEEEVDAKEAKVGWKSGMNFILSDVFIRSSLSLLIFRWVFFCFFFYDCLYTRREYV